MCISSYDKAPQVSPELHKAVCIGLHASTVGHTGLIPGWRTKILNAMAKSYKIELSGNMLAISPVV